MRKTGLGSFTQQTLTFALLAATIPGASGRDQRLVTRVSRPGDGAQSDEKSPDSVDHNLRLKADHNPRLGRWIVIQREPL